MKKILTAISVLALSAQLFAGGIDNKSNLSTGYLRNPSRNTETKRPEAVLYNIAGTSFMEDGLAFNVGNQFIYKNYANDLDFNNTKYEDKVDVFFFPDFEAVYKKDNWAAFAGFGVFAGGGSLDYKDGTGATYLALYSAGYKTTLQSLMAAGKTQEQAAPVADAMGKSIASNHSLKAYTVTMGELLGFSYNVTENVSLAAAGRLLHTSTNMQLKCAGIKDLNGGDKIKYEGSGIGFGGIFGVNVVDLVPKFKFSAQYQTITKLDVEFDSVTGNIAGQFGIVKGKKYHNDLPAVLSLGAGYSPIETVDISMSFNYYFNKQANMQNPLGRADLDYKDSWEIGLGCDWQATEKLCVSIGTMYSNQGTKSDVNSAFNPVLDSLVGGCGVEYKFTKQLMATLAYMHCRYFSQDYEFGGKEMELSKDTYLCSLGLTFKPF